MSAQPFDEELPEELKAVEDALRQLTPSLRQLNRDRLMYLAGQASAMNSSLSLTERLGVRTEAEQALSSAHAPRRIWWPITTAALALISLTLGGFLIFGKHGEQRIVYVDRPVTSSSTEVSLSEDSRSSRPSVIGPTYFELRDLVLTKGLDAVSMPETANEKSALPDPLTWPALRDELLHGKIGG